MGKLKQDFFSADFTGFLFKSVGGVISPERMEIFLTKLQWELSKFYYSKSTEANLIRLFSSLFDPASFISDSINMPRRLEIISAIVSNSNFLTDITVQNPGFLYQILDNEYQLPDLTMESLTAEITSNLNKFKTHTSKLNYLKQVKKGYILKIGLNDILGNQDLETTTIQLSILAGSLLSVLFDLCRQEIETKYNVFIPTGSYCLTSLGKLGGNELNYSSDVDLMLFYEKDYFPIQDSKKEYFELLNETALLFIKSSSEITEKGYLYRIDFRLRPDGKNSPLCSPITDYMRYYESRGENWERQMLIKLNFICGNLGLYYSFKYYLQGFIFPSSPQDSIKEQINKIKKDIERKIEGNENIKLFAGGIRDIEFSVQALQLLNGGKIRELRNGNTLESIDLLVKNKLLSMNEGKSLAKAYIFYRKTEHFLQLMNDRQTHLIPEDEELLNKLVTYLNLKNRDRFVKLLSANREKTKKIFNRILKPDSNSTASLFTRINFADKIRSGKNFKFLQSGAGMLSDKGFEAKTIDNFRLIEPAIIKHLLKSAVPDKIIENFTKVIRASNFPGMWYSQLQNRFFLNPFLRICEYSQKSIDIIASDKLAEDKFISGNCFIKPETSLIAENNFNELLLTLSSLYALGKITEKQLSVFLSEYIDSRLKKLSENFSFTYFIAALGSSGAREMNFASDIDFLLVIEEEDKLPAAEKEFEALIKQFRKEIGTFEIDLRLRPEGKSSQLVRTIKSYETYIASRARIWEFQSFTKLRHVCGSDKLFGKFDKLIIERIKRLDHKDVKAEILEMHKALTKQSVLTYTDYIELKKSAGGFVTIEFVIHYILFSNPVFYKKCMGKPVPEIIWYLVNNSVYKEEMDILAQNYLMLKKYLLTNQNYNNYKNYKFDGSNFPDTGIKTEQPLKKLKEIMDQNINIFNKILGN